jgi:hypothetical protein
MVCQDVTRELATPTGQVDAAELNRHLATCPRCAAWARQAEQFDRAWEATRPDEPSSAAFQSLWARVCQSLDAVADQPIAVRSWKRRGFAVAVMAQAAVLLVAGILLFRGDHQNVKQPLMVQNDPPAPVNSVFDHGVLLSVPVIDVRVGEPMMVSMNTAGKIVEVKPLKQMETSYVVAADFEMLNTFEALAE